MCGAIGQLVIFLTLGTFGSIALVTVTITRKMLSVLLSVVVYGHVVTRGQWAGVAVLFGGIVLDAAAPYWSREKAKEKKEVHQKEE